MKQYFVYILKCADGSFYTGITNNLERRFNEHQSGYNPTAYTHSRRPVELVFYTDFPDPTQAIAFEKQVKGWSRKKKEAIIDRNWDRLKLLAECKNETSHRNYYRTGFDSAQPDIDSVEPDIDFAESENDSGMSL